MHFWILRWWSAGSLFRRLTRGFGDAQNTISGPGQKVLKHFFFCFFVVPIHQFNPVPILHHLISSQSFNHRHQSVIMHTWIESHTFIFSSLHFSSPDYAIHIWNLFQIVFHFYFQQFGIISLVWWDTQLLSLWAKRLATQATKLCSYAKFWPATNCNVLMTGLITTVRD